MARPRTGQLYYSHSFSLTREQIDWVNKNSTNASELLRKLIDQLIALGTDADESKLNILAVENQIDLGEQEQKKLLHERAIIIGREAGQIYGKEHHFDWETATPLPTREAQYKDKVIKGYTKRLKDLDLKIAELKAKVIKEA